MRALWLFALMATTQLLAQEKASDTTQYVVIEHADVVIYDEERYGQGVQLLKGNVLLEHQGAFISSDSAFFNGNNNSFEAYGNVHAFQGDSIQMCSDKMLYDGNTRVMKATDSVVVYESRVDLYTDTVYYYRDSSLVTYPSNGLVMDSANTLTSVSGEYWMDLNTIEFEDSGVLTNPQCTVYSDLMTYNTQLGIATLDTRSKIVGKGSTSYADRGKYFSNENEMKIWGNLEHHFDEYIAWADSANAWYEPLTIGKYYRNIELWDSVNKVHLYADTLHIYKEKDSFSLTGTPTIVRELKKENMYLHSDTIIGYRDVDSARLIDLFPQTKMFKTDVSSKSQEIHINERTRQITLQGAPVLWPQEHQITGTEIIIQLDKDSSEVDSFYVIDQAFLINQDLDTANYNQIKGREMKGNVTQGDLDDVFVVGNGEVLYFVRDRKNKMMGVYKVKSSTIFADFIQGQIERYRLDNNPKGDMSPLKDVPLNTRKLLDFEWRKSEKPTQPLDIYYWDTPSESKRKTLPQTKSWKYKNEMIPLPNDEKQLR